MDILLGKNVLFCSDVLFAVIEKVGSKLCPVGKNVDRCKIACTYVTYKLETPFYAKHTLFKQLCFK